MYLKWEFILKIHPVGALTDNFRDFRFSFPWGEKQGLSVDGSEERMDWWLKRLVALRSISGDVPSVVSSLVVDLCNVAGHGYTFLAKHLFSTGRFHNYVTRRPIILKNSFGNWKSTSAPLQRWRRARENVLESFCTQVLNQTLRLTARLTKRKEAVSKRSLSYKWRVRTKWMMRGADVSLA